MSTIEMKDMIIPANFPQLYPSIFGAWRVSCLSVVSIGIFHVTMIM